MPKPATELMQEILFSMFLDSIDALKRASNGLPNQLVRDVNAIHRNTTFADLPKDVQDAIGSNVRAAFTRLLKEGYSVSPTSAVRPAQPASPHAPGPRRGPPRGRPGGDNPRGRPSGEGPRNRPSGDGPRRPRATRRSPARVAEIANLRQARKRRDRKAAEDQATINRAAFGRTKAQKQADSAETQRVHRQLDQARRED